MPGSGWNGRELGLSVWGLFSHMSVVQAGKTNGWVQAVLSARALSVYIWLGLPHSMEALGQLDFLHGGTGL